MSWRNPGRFHPPRAKSGNGSGCPPGSMDRPLSSTTALIMAPSYPAYRVAVATDDAHCPVEFRQVGVYDALSFQKTAPKSSLSRFDMHLS